MKVHPPSRPLLLSFLTILTILACGFPGASASPPPDPTATEIIQIAEHTATIPPSSATAEALQEATATSSTPSCTVLQDLNLRFGPGTAYRPPIRTLSASSVVTPLGFAPKGIPQGNWVYVQDRATQDKGWISAGTQYVSCNVELTALPSVAFGTPPPPPLPRSAQTSDPDGSGFCVDLPSEYTCVGLFSDQSLFQFQILKNGIEQGQDDGVEPISFRVSRIPSDDPSNKITVYEKTENRKPYCIFGDSGSCNGWVVEEGVYKWTKGGTPIEPGEYEMEVNATINGESTRWAVNFTLTLP